MAGCGSDEAQPDPADFPPGLEVCADVQQDESRSSCLDAIEARLQNDTLVAAAGDVVVREDFLAVVNPVADVLKQMNATTEFSLDSSLGDVDDLATSVEPLATTWRIDGTSRTLWACFHGEEVTISAVDC